ncbi:hypothetical protein CCH79_00020383 [Gambusia affinis]|uniref:Uncharacterized protein n=1 Tax=Gambusia affinis TaxID=33528 RepID=A0A315VH31_GAMAF|nr:hypothetical protein CCH79_00020383 [Gambusia affinis]
MLLHYVVDPLNRAGLIKTIRADPGQAASRPDPAAGSGLAQTLQQEFSLVNLQIRNVNVEVSLRPRPGSAGPMDARNRSCVVSAHFGGQRVHLVVNFPVQYPNNAAPSFQFVAPTTIPSTMKTKIQKGQNRLAQRNQLVLINLDQNLSVRTNRSSRPELLSPQGPFCLVRSGPLTGPTAEPQQCLLLILEGLEPDWTRPGFSVDQNLSPAVCVQVLMDTSLQKVKRNQNCLEPCVRQLVSCLESDMVRASEPGQNRNFYWLSVHNVAWSCAAPCWFYRRNACLTLQGVLTQQRPPLARVQLVAAALLRLLLHHVTPGAPEGLGQRRADPTQPGHVHWRTEEMDGTVVSGEVWWREDLRRERGVRRSFLHEEMVAVCRLTVFCSRGFWARVNPSRIFPRYAASLDLSANRAMLQSLTIRSFWNRGDLNSTFLLSSTTPSLLKAAQRPADGKTHTCPLVLLTCPLGVLLRSRPAVQAVSRLLVSQHRVVSGHGVSVIDVFVLILQCSHTERLRVKGQPTCPATPALLDPPGRSPNSRLRDSDWGRNRWTCESASRPGSAKTGSRPRYPRPCTPSRGLKSTGVTSLGAKDRGVLSTPGSWRRGFLFRRGPMPWPSFQPILVSNSTPIDDLGRRPAGGGAYLAGAMSSSSSESPGISAAWAPTALAFSAAGSLRLDENSSLVVISLGAMPCSPKSWRPYPAEKPPVNAPWNRWYRPLSSFTVCSCSGTGFFRGSSGSAGQGPAGTSAAGQKAVLLEVLDVVPEEPTPSFSPGGRLPPRPATCNTEQPATPVVRLPSSPERNTQHMKVNRLYKTRSRGQGDDVRVTASRGRPVLGLMVGSGSGPGSVMDLLRPEDRQRLLSLRTATAQRPSQAPPPGAAPPLSGLQEEALAAWRGSSSSSSSLQNFKPFENTPGKQARYEGYLSRLQQGDAGALEQSLDPAMTEWERGREREEFLRASILYRPSSSSLSSRFTRAQQPDAGDTGRDQQSGCQGDGQQVASGTFGKLTRETLEWHPDRLLCKRFNVPDPYPGSALVGLPKVKRDKFSVFDFLTDWISDALVPVLDPNAALNRQEASEGFSVAGSEPSRTSFSCSATPPKPLEEKKSRWDVSKETGHTQNQAGSEPTGPVSDHRPSPPQGAPAEPHTAEEEEEEEERPPMDLFKAIFITSSEEQSSSSSEEDGDEDEEAKGDEEPVKLFGIASSSSSNRLAGPVLSSSVDFPSMPLALSSSSAQMPSREEEEEFGPKLPPPSAADATRGATAAYQKSSRRSKEKKQKKKKQKHRKEKKVEEDEEERASAPAGLTLSFSLFLQKKKHRKHKAKQQKKSREEESSSSEDGEGIQPSTDDLLRRSEVTESVRVLSNLSLTRFQAEEHPGPKHLVTRRASLLLLSNKHLNHLSSGGAFMVSRTLQCPPVHCAQNCDCQHPAGVHGGGKHVTELLNRTSPSSRGSSGVPKLTKSSSLSAAMFVYNYGRHRGTNFTEESVETRKQTRQVLDFGESEPGRLEERCNFGSMQSSREAVGLQLRDLRFRSPRRAEPNTFGAHGSACFQQVQIVSVEPEPSAVVYFWFHPDGTRTCSLPEPGPSNWNHLPLRRRRAELPGPGSGSNTTKVVPTTGARLDKGSEVRTLDSFLERKATETQNPVGQVLVLVPDCSVSCLQSEEDNLLLQWLQRG